VEGGKIRAMQRFVSDAPWDDDKIERKYSSLINEDLGHPDGAIIFDESGFVKKGDDSIGVARQYCGTVGKVDNCQVGVFAAYTSAYGYALIDKRLYIPEQWFTEEYSERRKKCKLPFGVEFKTKPQLAVDMLQDIAKQEQIPFRYVLADSVYANSPEFVEVVEALIRVTYLLQVPEDTLCWVKNPCTITKHINITDKCGQRKFSPTKPRIPFQSRPLPPESTTSFGIAEKFPKEPKGQ
jgi:SRSO17 transposase